MFDVWEGNQRRRPDNHGNVDPAIRRETFQMGSRFVCKRISFTREKGTIATQDSEHQT